MRKLGLEDIFLLSAIIDKMELKTNLNDLFDKIVNVVSTKSTSDAQATIGGEMVMLLISNLHKAKKEVYEWIASIKEVEIEEVKAFSLKEVMQIFTEIFKSEDFSSLFPSAGEIAQK